jgi:TonB-linked SusC/RagA family outer membrane protein
MLFKLKTNVHMRKIASLLSVLMLLCTFAFGQTRTVTGKITDPQGNTVPFATVKVKNSNTGVSADGNGAFSILAAPTDVLVISATGFDNQEITVGDQQSVTVGLKLAKQLDEVIVTAQGIRKKARDIGYSYAKLSNEEVGVGRSPQLAQALSGKVSGLAVYNVSNSVDPQVKIVLRGYRSLTGNNEALIVLDGMQTTQTVLALINPNDIESVSILKGGQAATLYGSAGINGALVITTKKGAKGKLKVSYSNSTNFEQVSFLPEFQDKYGNGSHYATSFGQAGWKSDYLERMKDNWRPFENQQYGDAYDGLDRINGRVLEDGSKFILPYKAIKDVRRQAFDVGVSTNNQVSFQGGDQTGTYYLSIENNRIKGVVPKDKSERTGVRLASTREFGKLNVGFNASYVQADYKRTSFDFYNDLINTAAHIPLKDLRDWQNNKFANPNGYFNDYFNNPYFNKDNNRRNYTDANIQGNFDINYKATSWLNIYNRLGVMNNSRTQKSYTGKFLYTDWAKNTAFVPAPWDYANDYDGIDRAGTDILGAVGDLSTTENVLNNEFQLQMTKDFGQFSNKLVLGYSTYQRRTKLIRVASNSVVVPDIYNVSNRQGELTGNEGNSTERKYGYYADLTTGYKNWLILNGTFRYDNTSRFYKASRPRSSYSYPYYGVAVSFIATDAFPSLVSKTLNYAKLRVNYNKNGNDNIPLFGLDLSYPNGGGFPYGNTVGLTVGNTLPDAALKPEFVTSYEAGGEFQLFNNRVNLDVTAYTQQSKDQVITVKIPNSTGFPFQLINIGESKNWGYEADLKVQILRAKKLKLDWNIRYSYNDNKVIDLYPGVDQFVLADGFTYANVNVIKGSRFPVLKTDGYQYAPDGSGRRLVNSTSGYPLRNTTLTPRGGVLPRHIIGTGARMAYNDFSFAFNFEYRGGNVMFSDLGRQMTFTGSGKWTENRTPHVFPNSAYLDATGKPVDNNVLVREAEYGLWVDNYRLISENFVTPAWFIKLRDVNLAYNLPARLISKTKIFSAASVALYGRNLFTIIDKSNFYTDPEFSRVTAGGDAQFADAAGLGNGVGINGTGQTPPVRQFGFNINLVF